MRRSRAFQKIILNSFLFSFSLFLVLLTLIPSVSWGKSYINGKVLVDGINYAGYAGVSLLCEKKMTCADSDTRCSSRSYSYYEKYCSDWVTTYNGTYSMDDSDSSNCCTGDFKNTTWDTCKIYAYPYYQATSSAADSPHEEIAFACNATTVRDLHLRPKKNTIAVTITAGSAPVTEGVYVSCAQYGDLWTYSYVTKATNGVYRVPVTEGSFSCNVGCDWNYWNRFGEECIYSSDSSSYFSVKVGPTDTEVKVSHKVITKDKKIRLAVYAGKKRLTDRVSISCNQQSYPWTWGSTSKADMNGDYTLRVTEGDFSCYAWCNSWPCKDFGGSPRIDLRVFPKDSIVDGSLTFIAKDKKIRTKIMAGGRPVKSGMRVSCYEQGGSWDYAYDESPNSEGFYECDVGSGTSGTATYSVSAWCSNWQDCEVSGYPQGKVVFTEKDEPGTTADVTLTYLENNATFSGIVTDGESSIPNVWLSLNAHEISDQSGEAAVKMMVSTRAEVTHGQAKTTQVWGSTQTGSGGSFLTRIPAGTYTVQVWPPWYRQDLGQISKEVALTANGSTSLSLLLPRKRGKISGCIRDENGEAVPAYVNGWSYNGSTGQSDYFWTSTDKQGCYSARMVDGLTYTVTASPDTWRHPSRSLCGYTDQGMQVVTAVDSEVNVDFTVPLCDCTLTAQVKNDDGDIIPIGGSIHCRPESSSPSDYYRSNWGTMTAGCGKIKVESDEELTCRSWYWDSTYTSRESEVSCSCKDGASVCEFGADRIIPKAVTGTFRDSDGNSVELKSSSYVYVYATKGSNYRSCHTTKTEFSCDLSAGEWILGYWISSDSGYASASPGFNSQKVSVSSSGGTSYDLVLLQTASIHLTVLDLNNSGRPNVWVECCPYSASQEGANPYQYSCSCAWGETNSSGEVTLNVAAPAEDGVNYFCNAHIPYSMRLSENINSPEECSVKASPGQTGDCLLAYKQPDSQITVQCVGEDESGSSGSYSVKARSVDSRVLPPIKTAVNARESDNATPMAHATVDCFTPSGGSFEVETDEQGIATCPCTSEHTWYAVCHNLYGNGYYLSEVEEVACGEGEVEDDGVHRLEMDLVTVVPEAQSATVTDAATGQIGIELSDGFSVSFPPGSLGTANESVTCTVEPGITPFTPNKIPANFYGYFVQCLKQITDESGNVSSMAVRQLNTDATFTMPCNQDQLDNLGLTEDDVEVCFFDTSQGRYNSVAQQTIDCNEGISFQVAHLTDFVLVGNGYLGGVQGEDGGAIGKDDGAENGDAGTDDGTATDDPGATDAPGGKKSGGSGGGCSMTPTTPQPGWLNIFFILSMLLVLLRFRQQVSPPQQTTTLRSLKERF